MDIKPYRFKLPKVNAREQRALEALFEFLPRTGMREPFFTAISETLSSHLNLAADYRLESVTQESFESFCEKLPDPAVVAVLGIAPREGKILLDIDANLAGFCIERLLGGGTETFPSPKPLTEIDQGVLQYLILQLLAHIYRLCGQDTRVHFRFEKFLFEPKEVKPLLPVSDTALILNVKITVGNNAGFVRLAFPSPLVEGLYLGVEAKGEAREAERAYFLKRLKEFEHIKFPLWAEAGRTTISTGDMRSVESGDVVVLEDTRLTLNEEGIKGSVILRVGDGRHGGFISEVSIDPKTVHCRITDVKKGEDIL